VLEALYCVAPWCLQRRATSEAGEEVEPPGPRGLLTEASANIVVKAESVRVSVVRRPPCGQGTAPPFLGQAGGSLYACRTVLSTCGGMTYSVVA
jgi:hypothetical protein